MSINLEQIDLLRERANVSYEDAKDALEKCNNNIVEALVYLEKENKINSQRNFEKQDSILDKGKNIVRKGNRTKLVIKKQENTAVNVPVTIAVVSTIIAPHIALIAIVGSLVTGYKIRFKKENGEDVKEVNRVFDKVSTAVTNVATNMCKDPNESIENQ